MFSRNPRSWRFKRLNSNIIDEFKSRLIESRLNPVFIHTPYLLNLASPREEVYIKTVDSLKEELLRAETLNISFVVTHLGSHLGHGKKKMLGRVIKGINRTLLTVENKVSLLLENSAGTRNSIGSSFEDIGYIISSIETRESIVVCFDTCHAFAAGFDLISSEAVERTLSRFDETIGMDLLKLVHLNDSKGGQGSRIDRHQHIGLGKIGMEGIKNILRSKLGKYPLILETPIDALRDDARNLRIINELMEELINQKNN